MAAAAAYKSAAPRQRLQGVLDQKAKTTNPTQAELGGEASPPSAASTSAADLAQNGAKRWKMLEKCWKNVGKIYLETRLKHRLEQNAEKSPIIVTHDPKVGAPRPLRRHLELHRGAQSSKNVKNMY